MTRLTFRQGGKRDGCPKGGDRSYRLRLRRDVDRQKVQVAILINLGTAPQRIDPDFQIQPCQMALSASFKRKHSARFMCLYRYRLAFVVGLLLGLLPPSITAASYPPGSVILLQTFDVADGTTNLVDGSVIGSDQTSDVPIPVAGIYNAALRLLTKEVTNSIGAFKLPDLDPGNVVRGFDLKFLVRMEGATNGGVGEGWSINFGKIPEDNGTGEGGFAPLPRGLTISFLTRADPGENTAIQVSVGGVILGTFPKLFSFDQSLRSVLVHWDAEGLDLTYDTRAICTDLRTPGFVPSVGNRLAFTARAVNTSMNLEIDSLKFITQPLPALETGGPIISEFVANNTTYEDEFTDKPGWIELLNGSAESTDLSGWYLTDSRTNLSKWTIQQLVLNPYNYQVVFASGRDLQASPSNLIHANFTLDKKSGYLALVKPDGKSIASQFSYGTQEKNVAFGEAGPNRIVGYMFPASPGLVNTQTPSAASLSPTVEFSKNGGFALQPFELVLSAPPLPGLEIHYTLDRTEPGTNSPIYSNSIPITGFSTVKARSYAPGHIAGAVNSETYVFPDASLTDYAGSGKPFDSNLPFLFVDSFAFSVDGTSGGVRPYRPAYTVVVRPDPNTGRATLSTPPDYAGPSGVHLRGESSAGFDQHSYALELWDETANDQAVSLLGMPADSDWILYGPWSEKTMMRNKLIFDWMRSLRGNDGMAVRSEFVELFFNQTRAVNGQIGYSSYRGVYLLMEKLKRGKNRVPIENLNDKTVNPSLITGGYIFRKDKDDPLKNNWTTTGINIPLQSFDPDRLNTVQFNYLKNYVNTFDKALNGPAFRNLQTGYRAYLDPDTFIDAQWLLEISKQVDGYVFSTYFHKDRSGRLRAGPIWDFNIALGNADYGSGETPTGWLYDIANGVGQLWYPRLHSDPDYHLAHWDRYWQMRRSILATETVMATIDHHAHRLLDGYSGGVSNRAPASIQNPIARHFRKWPRLGQRDWPNPASSTKVKIWQSEVENLKNWTRTRLEWIDDQTLLTGTRVYRPPVLSHPGGLIHEPLILSVSSFRGTNRAVQYAEGTIYFTLDGSDPRLLGGSINPAARKYDFFLTIRSSLTIKARLYSQNQWSALATATFLYESAPPTSGNLAISEILYQPAPLTPAEITAGLVDSEKLEFLELRNRSHQSLNLAGLRFSNGIEFDFTFANPEAQLLRAGESVVLVSDKRAFSIRYPQVPAAKVVGEFHRQLNNGGETLTLETADGKLIETITYNNKSPWPIADTGEGHSLILAHPAETLNPSAASQWTLSARAGGTPGVSGVGALTFSGDPNRDTDNDGVADYFEYATGSDPEDPNSAFPLVGSVAPLVVNGVTAPYFQFSLRRNPVVPNESFGLETSTDLKSWTSSTSSLVRYNTFENPDGTITESYRAANPWVEGNDASQFIRLRLQSR